MSKRFVVGVMGSGREEWQPYSAQIGTLIAELGFNLLTGGGGGTMTAVARAFCEVPNRKGISIGIVPTERDRIGLYSIKAGYPNQWVELTISSPLGTFIDGDDLMPTRNHINIMSSDTLVILPGNKGTANEVALARLYEKTMFFFGPKDTLPVNERNASHMIDDVCSFLVG